MLLKNIRGSKITQEAQTFFFFIQKHKLDYGALVFKNSIFQ